MLMRMEACFNNIQTRKKRDYALTLLGIAKQVEEVINTDTDINKLCRIMTTLYKEYLTLLPYDDYAYEENFVLAYVELFGLDLEVLEALNKKDYVRIQRILLSV
jgi:hypothetical protein